MPIPPPAELSLAGRLAAHESWARTTDRSARTAPARAAADARFLDQADGDPVRAGHLRKAYFARLALRSAQARRRAGEARQTADVLDHKADDAERALSHAAVGGEVA